MTRKELRDLVVANLNGRTDVNHLVNSALDLCLEGELGQHHIFKDMRDEQETIAIVADQASIAITSGTWKLLKAILINGTSSHQIELLTKNVFAERYPYPAGDATGVPLFAYEEDDTLYVYPVCNDTYSITLTTAVLPSLAAADASEPTIANISNALVAYATWYVNMRLEQWIAAREWERERDRTVALAVRGDRRGGGVVRRMEMMSDLPVKKSEHYLDPFVRTN